MTYANGHGHGHGDSVVRRVVRRLAAAAAVGATALSGLVVAAPAEAVATKTVARWEMNEPPRSATTTEPITMVDNSGNGRHGEVGSTVTTGAVYEDGTGHRFPTVLPKDDYWPGHINTVPHHSSLNPDSGDYSFTVRYRTNYSFGNIMQKGQSTAIGGMWKFEAPGGSPKCAFVGSLHDPANNVDEKVTGYTPLDLSDNQWHTVTCNRTPDYVEMYVDGVRQSRAWGKTGDIANLALLSVGGKSKCGGDTGITCDNFIGDIDYIEIKKGAEPANVNPVADIRSSCTDLTCEFSGAGSTDADGTIASYAWNFGDGITGTGSTASHTYTAAGTYTVSLTVTDNAGGTDTTTRSVTVPAEAPTSAITFVGQSFANRNTTSHAVTVPSAVQAGDALVMFFSESSLATVGTPTGVTGWQQRDTVTSGKTRTVLWTKTAVAGDAGQTVRVPLSTRAKGGLVVAAYRGVDATNPVADLVRVAASSSSAFRTTPTGWVDTPGSWGISYWAHRDSSTSTFVPPAGPQVRANGSQTGGGRVTTMLADSGGPLGTGGYGGLTARAAAASSSATMWTVVLAPAG